MPRQQVIIVTFDALIEPLFVPKTQLIRNVSEIVTRNDAVSIFMALFIYSLIVIYRRLVLCRCCLCGHKLPPPVIHGPIILIRLNKFDPLHYLRNPRNVYWRDINYHLPTVDYLQVVNETELTKYHKFSVNRVRVPCIFTANIVFH